MEHCINLNVARHLTTKESRIFMNIQESSHIELLLAA